MHAALNNARRIAKVIGAISMSAPMEPQRTVVQAVSKAAYGLDTRSPSLVVIALAPSELPRTFTEWGACGATCGDSSQSRKFMVTVAAKHGGIQCEYEHEHMENRPGRRLNKSDIHVKKK